MFQRNKNNVFIHCILSYYKIIIKSSKKNNFSIGLYTQNIQIVDFLQNILNNYFPSIRKKS